MNPLPETPKQAARRLAGPMLDKGFKPEGLYEYANGSQSFYRIRLKHPDTGEKWIRPMWLNGRGWELGEPEFENGKPLYRLRELAEKPRAPAWYVEGENKVNALARLGVLATTAGSASSDERADFTPLASRAVTIWPDNDKPGIEHGERVAAKLRALGCRVELIDARALSLFEGGDSVNWFKANPNAKAADLSRLPRLRETVSAPASCADDVTDVTVSLIRGSDLKPEPIAWLWRDFLACGKLHIIAGAPGAGKTTIAMAFAATVTAGGCWPDETRAEPGSVLIWSGEDGLNDTLLPRLLVMGAGPNRIYFVGDVMADGKPRPFDPARDMQALEDQAARISDVRLLIVDPIVNAVAGDSHKNTETRRALQPIVDLASRLRAAALGVSHFSKNTAGRDPVE
ncbi:MAG: AAA family ATPase [Betaproteobacteria bacterium]|nr:AAA family ATPase [Betaproteobacteria bacterium]